MPQKVLDRFPRGVVEEDVLREGELCRVKRHFLVESWAIQVPLPTSSSSLNVVPDLICSAVILTEEQKLRESLVEIPAQVPGEPFPEATLSRKAATFNRFKFPT